jgi:hypothetical protein
MPPTGTEYSRPGFFDGASASAGLFRVAPLAIQGERSMPAERVSMRQAREIARRLQLDSQS